MLRAVIFTLGGSIVAGALVAGSVTFLIGTALSENLRLTAADFIGSGTFGGLSLVIAFLGFRAWRRVRRGDTEGFAWVAKVFPVLFAAGLIGGAYISVLLVRDSNATAGESLRGTCNRMHGNPYGRKTVAKDALDRCIELAKVCDAVEPTDNSSAAQLASSDRWPAKNLGRAPTSHRQRVKGLCLIDKLKQTGSYTLPVKAP